MVSVIAHLELLQERATWRFLRVYNVLVGNTVIHKVLEKIRMGGAHTNYVINSENTPHFFQAHFRIQDAEVLAPNSK